VLRWGFACHRTRASTPDDAIPPAAENQPAAAQRPDPGSNDLPVHGQRNEHHVVEYLHPDPAERQHEHRHDPVRSDRDHELQAGAMRAVARLRFGAVWVNDHITGASEMPHGGFKRSGYGRDLSMAALDHFTKPRHVMVRW
jgi:hypothetical protein